MKRFKKILFKAIIYLLISIVSFVSILILVLQYSFPSNFVRIELITYLKNNYKIELEIKKINFSLFNGLSLEGVSVKNDKTEDIGIIEFNSFLIDYDLMAYLLDRKVILNKISLDAPKISLLKDIDGEKNWNYEDMINKFVGDIVKEDSVIVEDRSESEIDSFKIDFNMKEFIVSNVMLSYNDGNHLANVKGLNLEVKNIAFIDLENYSAEINVSFSDLHDEDIGNIIYKELDLDSAISASIKVETKISVDINKSMNDESLDLVNLNFFTRVTNLFFKQQQLRVKGNEEVLEPINIDETNNNFFDLNLSFHSRFNEYSDSLTIDNLIFNFSDLINTHFNVDLANLLETKNNIFLDFKSKKVELNLRKIYDLAYEFGLNEILDSESLKVDFENSFLNIDDLSVEGNLDKGDLKIDLVSELILNDFKFEQKQNTSLEIKEILNETSINFSLNNFNRLKQDSSIFRNDLTINKINVLNDGKRYKVNSIELGILPILSDNFLPKEIDLFFLTKGILDSKQYNYISDSLKVIIDESVIGDSELSVDALLKTLKIHNKLDIAKLELSDSLLYLDSENKFNTVIDFDSKFNLDEGKVKIYNEMVVSNTTFRLDSLNDISLVKPEKIINKIAIDLNKYDFNNTSNNNLNDNTVILDSLFFSVNDYLKFNMFNSNFKVEKNLIDLGKILLEVNFNSLEKQYHHIFSDIFETNIDIIGLFQSTTDGTISLQPETAPKISLNSEIDLEIKELGLNDKMLDISGLKINEKIILNNNNDVSIQSNLLLDSFDFNNNTLEQYPEIKNIDLQIENELLISNNFRDVKIVNLSFNLKNLQNELKFLKGHISFNKNFEPSIALDMVNTLKLKPSYSFTNSIDSISGIFIDTVSIRLDTTKILTLNQNIVIDNLSLNLYLDTLFTQNIFLSNMNSNIPISLKLDLEKMELLRDNNNNAVEERDFYKYMSLREDYRLSNNIPVSNFSIDNIFINHSLLKTRFDNIEADIYFKNNKFNLNRYYLELFDGNLTGNLVCDIKEGKLDETVLERLNILAFFITSGINTKYLSKVMEQNSYTSENDELESNKKTSSNPSSSLSSSSNLNFTANLEINGVKDIISKPKITGDVSITRISDDDVSYLLDFLNKAAKDQSISMLQNVLNMFPGIEVNLMSFKLKNNFIYTMINLHKPWYLFYFPLAEDIRLSKQSLKFYLDKYVGEE